MIGYRNTYLLLLLKYSLPARKHYFGLKVGDKVWFVPCIHRRQTHSGNQSPIEIIYF